MKVIAETLLAVHTHTHTHTHTGSLEKRKKYKNKKIEIKDLFYRIINIRRNKYFFVRDGP